MTMELERLERRSVEAVASATADRVADGAKSLFAHGRFASGMDLLYMALSSCRTALTARAWQRYCADFRQDDELMETVLESPITRRALEKPRGYAGDAVLIDYIYGCGDVSSDPPTSASGREILAWEYESPGSKSVRARRDIMARALDTAADEKPNPNVLAVACGHLREIALSSAAQRRAFNWFIGIDQDGDSLAEVDRCYGKYGISTVPATIQSLISRRRTLPTFDLIYASGLYDYLPERTAQTLTSVLFGMLSKGGRLLIGNFAPEMRDIGYMEAVMDWRLLYRTEVDMLGLSARIDSGKIGTVRTFREPHNNIVFLDVVRA